MDTPASKQEPDGQDAGEGPSKLPGQGQVKHELKARVPPDTPGACMGCGRETYIFCPRCVLDGQDFRYIYYCRSSPKLSGANGHSHICGSHFVRTYLVRAGLLSRGMILHGRTLSYNKMVEDLKKGKPIPFIHPAMPSSELQFWLFEGTARHMDTWFSVIFTELLSGLPVKSIEAVTYIVHPVSILTNYHHYVQKDPSHRIYKITLDTNPEQAWALDPGGARLAYEEMLTPWKVFEARRLGAARGKAPLGEMDVQQFGLMMGMCQHSLGAGGKKKGSCGGDESNFGDDVEPIERRGLRAWAHVWTDLLPEIFAGSMFNLGTLGHADFCVAMDEFLAIFRAYVKTYLLETEYHTYWVRDYGSHTKWTEKMRDGHPDFPLCSHRLDGVGGDPYDDHSCDEEHEQEDCCHTCTCTCHDEFERALREVGQDYSCRWEFGDRIKDLTGKEAADLPKLELLKATQRLLVDRASLRLRGL